MSTYDRRRYRYRDGRLEKEWHGKDDGGWHKTKEAAMDAATAPEPDPAPAEAHKPKRKPRAKKAA